MYEFQTKFKCKFCQNEWGDRYYDGHRRPDENEAHGRVCPKCGVMQYQVPPHDLWKQYLRMFMYGRVHIRNWKELENYIGENYLYHGTGEVWRKENSYEKVA